MSETIMVRLPPVNTSRLYVALTTSLSVGQPAFDFGQDDARGRQAQALAGVGRLQHGHAPFAVAVPVTLTYGSSRLMLGARHAEAIRERSRSEPSGEITLPVPCAIEAKAESVHDLRSRIASRACRAASLRHISHRVPSGDTRFDLRPRSSAAKRT